jgi:hypothetical protein
MGVDLCSFPPLYNNDAFLSQSKHWRSSNPLSIKELVAITGLQNRLRVCQHLINVPAYFNIQLRNDGCIRMLPTFNDYTTCFLFFEGENACIGSFLCTCSDGRCSPACFWRQLSSLTANRPAVGNLAYWCTFTNPESDVASCGNYIFEMFGRHSPCSCSDLCQFNAYRLECWCSRFSGQRFIILGKYKLSRVGTVADNVRPFDWNTNHYPASITTF